jgi:DNA topoisomerase-1
VQRGTAEDLEKPQNASLLKGMTPEQVDLATALKLLSLPRELGTHPQTGAAIVAYNGRFGPYIKSGDDTRSLPANLSPLDVTLEQAIELLAQPKTMRRSFGAPREPLKTLGESPVTKQPVKLMSGRYGPYVTDGVTNASVPKEWSVDEVSLERSLDLLAVRAAAGPPQKRGRKGSAKKAATPKKSVAKKSAVAKKAPAKKKSAE